MLQNYRIADLTVSMETFGRTERQAEPYRIDGAAEPEIRITSDWRTLKEAQPQLSVDDCEYMSTGGAFYRQLLNHQGMMLHSSAVVMDGRAYLFSAPCGTGKSTHTALWQKVFGERARILNDDKPALRMIDGIWYAYGTPWSGKYDKSINMRAPLAGICILRRGDANKIERYVGFEAIHALLEQTLRSKHPEMMQKTLELLDKLLLTVPVWRMECNTADEAAVMSHRVMSGEAEQ